MQRLRIIFATLIALAVAVAPLGAAKAAHGSRASATVAPWAGVVDTGQAKPGQTKHGHAGHGTVAPVAEMAGMADCLRMHPRKATTGPATTVPGKTDCPCCDSQSCPPDLCPFKFSKVLATLPAIEAGRDIRAVLPLPAGSERPPDWIDDPRPPPPRT